MVTILQAQRLRIAALDLIKIFAICGVLLIHLVGKRDFGGIFWYAQAVPIFMVLMGYHCKDKLNWRAVGKAYVGYLLLFMASLVLALLANAPLSLRFLPLGFLPFEGPGTYWILQYFLFIFISPLLCRLRRRVPLHLFLLVLFMSGWAFDMMYELAVENPNCVWGG